ncbi:hypothetical protein COB64_03940 [Candidatus Wolfebacteria bacterium]|nr:MAG: hypothetical protein COB64_03940 [Candidatus Wolfebacteria bacterium]
MHSTTSTIKITLTTIAVLFIFKCGLSQDPLQIPIDNITPNPPVTPSGKLIDRFNNIYTPTNFSLLKTSNQAINCSGFIVDFEDVILGNGLGFDDQSQSPCDPSITVGEERRNTVCAVFGYVASVIDLGGANPEILFTVSDTTGTGPLGAASALYFDTVVTGFVGGFIWERVVNLGGADPDNDSTTYDATIEMDFGPKFLDTDTIEWNSCNTQCAAGQIDLYSIVLHEITHALGIASFISETGASGTTGLFNGPYTIYDQFLMDPSFSFNLINGFSTFTGTAPNDLIGCWYFEAGNTQQQPVFSDSYALPPPPPFNNSSFSHFDEDRSNFRFIMRASTSGGNDRFYTQPEIEVLENLGYTINNANLPFVGANFPTGNPDFDTTTIGEQICINVLANDNNPTGTMFIGSCDQDLCTGSVSTPGVLILTGGGNATINGGTICYTPDSNFIGTAHFQYCLEHDFTADSLVNIINTVDVYVEVLGDFCPDDLCGFVCNGSFEAGIDPCVPPGLSTSSLNGFPNTVVNNWFASNATPDLCVRGVLQCNPQPSTNPQWFDIPNNIHAGSSGPGVETHDSPNNRYIGLISNGSGTGYIEGVTTRLIDTLTSGKQYTLTIWVYPRGNTGVDTLMIFLTDSMAMGGISVPFPGKAPTPVSYNIVADAVDQVTGINPPLGTWTEFTLEFTAPSVPNTQEQFLVIEPRFPSGGGLMSFIIDDVRLFESDTIQPIIVVEKTVVSTAPFKHGDTVTYEISVCNTDTVKDGFLIVVEDLLPPGLTLISSTFSSFPTDTIDTLLLGMCDTLFVSARIDSNVVPNELISNCTFLTSGGNCSNLALDDLCEDITVASTDISIVKTANVDSIVSGDTVTYSIFVTNTGDAPATNVIVEDILPNQATIIASVAPGGALVTNNNTITVTFASLDTGQSVSIIIATVINSSCDGAVENCAQLVSIAEIEEDINNNSSCINVQVGTGSSGLTIDSITATAATCKDTCNGTATIYACGGLPPLAYQWDDSLMQTTSTAVNLCRGWVKVTITDAANSVLTDSVFIQELTVFAGLTDVDVTHSTSCLVSNGAITVNPIMGLPPYSYAWSNGDTTQTITGLSGGVYFVTVSDALGCVAPSNLFITIIDSIPLAEVSSSPCTGIIGPDIVNPDYTYSWALSAGLSDPYIANPIADPNVTTPYVLTVTDTVSGCTESYSVTVNAGPYDYFDLTITGNVVWTTPKKIKNLLKIDPGAKLTINNTTVEFGPHRDQPIPDVGVPVTGILVAPGGELVVNNSTLTTINDCDSRMWSGIQVWGDLCKNCPVNTLDHGEVTIQNNSIIKNAHAGVLAFHHPTGFGGFNLNFGAGIVKAFNSDFINCWGSIGLGKSNYPSESQILGCTFINDALMADQQRYPGQGTDIFINIDRIDGATLLGNTFNNTNLLDLDKRSTGIRSFDAGYIANSNTFVSLTKGIDASGTGIVAGIIMRNNTFTGTRQGITCQGNNFDDISSNTFNVLDGEVIGLDTFPTWAVFMLNTTGFIVTKNNINTDNVVTDNTYGVVVRNSDGMGGDVYKNDFTGAFSVASQMEQDNSLLQIRCNEYADVSSFDWAVTSGVLAEQGGCDPVDDASPAGNRFHSGCSGQEHIFTDGTVPLFIYNTHPIIPPTCNSGGANVQPCAGTTIDTANIDAACPDLFVTGGGGGGHIGPDTTGNGNVVKGKFISMINKTKDTKQKLFLHNGLIRFAISRGETDFAIQRLQSLNTVTSAKILVAQYVHTKERQKARKHLKKIPPANEENRKFKKLFDKLIDIQEKEQNLQEISVVDELVIRDVADSKTKAATKAETVLAMIEKEKYNRKPERINQQGLKMAGDTDVSSTNEEETELISLDEKSAAIPTITLAPNPFKESTTITYQLPFSTEYGEIVIYNTVGHVVARYKVIGSGQIEYSNSNLAPGIYVCNYIHGNKVIESLKMVIIK